MKEIFEKAEVEIIELNANDVIVTSGGATSETGGESGGWTDEDE